MSLDELLERHTLGQIILMGAASAVSAEPEESAAAPKPAGKSPLRPPKPYREMTLEEDRAFFFAQGGHRILG